MNVLFVTMDGGGNLPPLLGIAREAARRGGRVRVLGHSTQRAAIEAADLEFVPLTTGYEYDASAPRSTVGGVRDLTRLFADRDIGRDALDAARKMNADVVVVDCLLWGALIELSAAGVNTVSLVHSQFTYFRSNARGPVGMLARLRGTSAVAAEQTAGHTLVATREDFETDDRRTHRDGVNHLGFVWQEVPVAATRDAARPRVLVSFSTTSFPGQARALQSVLDALVGLDIDVVVTTGAVDPAQLRIPTGMRVERRLDHGAVLPTTSLVIDHGGHATTARALSHGIPVLVMPMHPLMDQPAIGRAVERLGVGRSIPKTSSTARIRTVVMDLLHDEAIAAAAAAVGGSARERDGAVVAVDLLERIVAR